MISISSVNPTAAAAATAATSAAVPSIQPQRRQQLLFLSPPQHHHSRRCLTVRAIDAAQPYDYEAQLNQRFTQSTRLRIAIVGFGNFGQFLAKTFIRQGHTVYAFSRSNYSSIAQSMGAVYFSDVHDLCENHPDVILLCTSILSTEQVLKSLPLQRLRRNTLFVDVLSVKEFPKNIFLQVLPTHFDILCTHPMFGPESGKYSWQDLPFVYDKVRIGDEDSRLKRVDNFLDIFKKEGCRMVEMSCSKHDRYAAGSQFITHTMGRILEKLELEDTPINTRGYETLLDLVENTSSDSFDLYYGLFMYNKNAMEQIERLDLAFEALKKELFGHIHEVLRKQLFGKSEEGGAQKPILAKLPKNNNGTPLLPSPSESVSSRGDGGGNGR
ncbi:arogenate dehydrogenase 2, chloroplastic-like [Henckelia pumila]|uniref:arogenate dehydrogenase 2, chloroplastic-like n=1 Tax=Henckelia pumila TaxID=405737 RepID=UPI003C6E6187